jgi:hypothetical protein
LAVQFAVAELTLVSVAIRHGHDTATVEFVVMELALVSGAIGQGRDAATVNSAGSVTMK